MGIFITLATFLMCTHAHAFPQNGTEDLILAQSGQDVKSADYPIKVCIGKLGPAPVSQKENSDVLCKVQKNFLLKNV